MMREMINLLDVPMHPWTMEETIAEIDRRLEAGIPTQHVVVNVAKLISMQADQTLREAVLGCDIINIDGMGVVYGARFLGHQVPERVAGIDLFYRLLELATQRSAPVYLLGATPEVLENAVQNLRLRFPTLDLVGWHHGYFWEDEAAVVEKIRDSGAKLLFVAISSPLKEQFAARWKAELGATFVMGVGGTFDVVAGKTKRAPIWMQRYGLEWLYRLIQEPNRMWRRYMVTNSKFAWLLLVARLKGNTHERRAT